MNHNTTQPILLCLFTTVSNSYVKMFAKTKKIALRLSSCLLSVGRNVLSKLIKNGFQKIMPVN